ncbi:MAG: hypothetical protein Q8N63_07755 [Nanoarchaeota archaeon]|nr:hypothetical protein [Nanoarchaeota archaeon]
MRKVKYIVVLKEGKDADIRQKFYAPKEQIQEIFKSCSFDEETYRTKHVIDMNHIVFTGKPEDIKTSKKSAKAEFIKETIGSLEFHVDTEEDADKCLKYFKLR